MHALLQEHFVRFELFQRLLAEDTCTVDCGHKQDVKNNMFILFSSSDQTAHECSLAIMPTAIQ